jgi:uncharacterized protein
MSELATPAVYVEVELIPLSPDDPLAAAMARRGVTLCRAHQPVARRVESPQHNLDRPLLSELRAGRLVAWDEAAAVFVARKSGHVWLRQGRLEVEDTLDFHDDIDAATGPFFFDGDLVLHKNVLDSASVKAAGNITLHGAVEAAELHAGGDLVVHHGICGKDRGQISARRNLSARFITNARVSAGADLLVANEIVNSHILCGGALKAPNGTILAGHAIAQTGILCHTVGSEVGQATTLEIGLAPDAYASIQKTIAAADAARQKAREIRAIVEPLLARAKSLTAAQKEKATELLFTADQADTSANQALAAFESSRTALHNCLGTRITVSSLVHPGVLIRFPLAEGMVTSRLRGPIDIALENHGSESRVVLIDASRNRVTPLPPPPGSLGQQSPAFRILFQPGSNPS